MKKSLKKIKLAGALAALGLLSTIGTAQAAIFEIDFTTAGAFSGVVPGSPGSNTVFATAIFDDSVGPNKVQLTMNVLNNLPSGAYVNDWYFNVNSAPLGAINFVSGFEATANPKPVEFLVANSYKADGSGGNFDFAFHFKPSNPGELGQTHTSVYTLERMGITAGSFNSLSVPDSNGGGYVSAIHVQGYGNSVWISGRTPGLPQNPAEVPEPATLALLGLGLFGLAATRRRLN